MAVSNSNILYSWPGMDECGSHMDFALMGGVDWTGEAGVLCD